MFFFSPLEQFQILQIYPFFFENFDFSITNSTVILEVGLGIFLFLYLHTVSSSTNSFYIMPNRVQVFLEVVYEVVNNLLVDNAGLKAKNFFPYFFTLFVFILISNVIGLVPYSFTVTSHLILTFALALMTFIGINIVCLEIHGINLLSLFLPTGSSFALSLLLVPIEIVSYVFRPISLSVRLFANMMAGHTLLKVIAGFSWTMMLSGGGLAFAHILPLLILVLLMGLEFGVAIIQAYVFTILTCIYLNDAINMH